MHTGRALPSDSGTTPPAPLRFHAGTRVLAADRVYWWPIGVLAADRVVPGLADRSGGSSGHGGKHVRVVQVAGDRLSRRQLAELRLLLLADRHDEWASRVEVAALRPVD